VHLGEQFLDACSIIDGLNYHECVYDLASLCFLGHPYPAIEPCPQAVVSKRCMSYSLGVRRRGPDGRWAVVGVDEAILKCVVKCGLLRRCELDKLKFFLGHWRSFVLKRRNEPPDDPNVAETV
jgi:hypothetical protein